MQKDKRHSSPKYCLSQIIAYANIAGYEISVFVRYQNDYFFSYYDLLFRHMKRVRILKLQNVFHKNVIRFINAQLN